LVYIVENHHFTVASDDHYDRVRRVALRMQEILENPLLSSTMKEINGIKPLFGNQGWTRPDAITFIRAAVAHLGNA
jgi:hypothetical protein